MNPPTRPRRRAIATGVVSAIVLLTGACSSVGSDAAESPTELERLATTPGDGSPFDPTVVHDLAINIDEGALDEMIATYEDTGEKTWIEATVTVDGSTYEQAGLRLKGNSSLRGVSGTSAEDLPWLVRLDQFVEGQTHQGYEDIVVRSNSSATSLNETVALALLAEAGLASEDSAPARFSVNGSEATLRLIVEHPDDDEWYETTFDGPGALYKSESTGDWSYRGDDPEAYTDVFDQEGGKDVTDLTPLIGLLQFLDEADDATFAAELADHLDVDAFATYLAMMDLVDNFDDIDGPGNNSYLWWDAETERFTVVPWDLNLAFGTFPGGGAGPGAGGGFPGGGDGGPPDGAFPGGPPTGDFTPGDLPTGDLPTGDVPAGDEPAGPGGAGGPRGFGRSNVLVERFHATEQFEALYQQRLTELGTELFDSGRAQELLDTSTDILLTQATDLVGEATIRTESEAIAAALG